MNHDVILLLYRFLLVVVLVCVCVWVGVSCLCGDMVALDVQPWFGLGVYVSIFLI